MVDALDSKSSNSDIVRVQVPSQAPNFKINLYIVICCNSITVLRGHGKALICVRLTVIAPDNKIKIEYKIQSFLFNNNT